MNCTLSQILTVNFILKNNTLLRLNMCDNIHNWLQLDLSVADEILKPKDTPHGPSESTMVGDLIGGGPRLLAIRFELFPFVLQG